MKRFLFAALLLIALPTLAADQKKQVAIANNAFAIELYMKLAGNKGNLFFSPFSISSALGMTWAGARGATATEMATAMHFGADTHAGLAALGNQFTSRHPGYQLAVANRLYVKDGFKLLEPFTKLTTEQYGAPVEQVDFSKHETRTQANKWVASQTNQRIKDLVPKGVFSADTRLALINAIYFKGTWGTPFDKKATAAVPFFAAGKEVKVQMMYADLMYGAGAAVGGSADVEVLELPYAGGEASMVILLPKNRDGLPALEKGLTPEKFNQLTSRLISRPVEVWLPKFKLEQSFGLGATLESMGMPSAFSKDKADFSAMTGTRDLFISAVIHKAFVEVNEEGTEAAAATGVVMGITSIIPPRAVFRADHPFIFALRDNRTGAVLFLGRVVEPQ